MASTSQIVKEGEKAAVSSDWKKRLGIDGPLDPRKDEYKNLNRKGITITEATDQKLVISTGQSFEITTRTKIAIDGVQVKPADLKAGMTVIVYPGLKETQAGVISVKLKSKGDTGPDSL
jgi:hypothetical protein